MTDIVYLLGTGSGWYDNEIRYSIRSLEMFVSDIRNIYIVGQRPKWLTNVIHLPFPDSHGCKERNIMLKMAYVCGHPDLSENFLHIHDDHFALAPQSADNIPYWRGESLQRLYQHLTPDKKSHWHNAVENTFNVLKSRGLTTYNFDLHYPMLINKKVFPEIMDRYDWKTPRGYVVKSLYANTIGIPGDKMHDLKLSQRHNYGQLVSLLKGKNWFSLGNSALNFNLKNLLQAVYPQGSQHELFG